MLVTQAYWSEETSNTVYETTGYNGNADINNSNNGILVTAYLADCLTSNTTDGYVLTKTIKVAG